MRKNIWLLVGLCPTILGCDDSEHYLQNLDEYPTVFVNDRDNFIDSIKLSSFSRKKEGYIQLKTSSTLGVVERIDLTHKGKGDLFFNGQLWDEDRNLPSDINPLSLKYQPLEEGQLAIQFTVTNSFQKKAIATYKVLVFQNLPPITKLQTRKRATTGSMEEWVLDATASYDLDYRQGGGIIEYEFDIAGKETITTDRPIANYAFEPGEYPIKVRTKDNDGQWSDAVNFIIETEKK